jgi:VCBS repeat-containing protein
MASWLQKAAAYLSEGVSGSGVWRSERQSLRRAGRRPALRSEAVADIEYLEARQMLSAAEVTAVSVSGNPGDNVQMPVRVTSWDGLTGGETLNAFEIYLTYDTERLDLSAAGVELGPFFVNNDFMFTDLLSVSDVDGTVSLRAELPFGDSIPVPDLLPDLVRLNFTISPDAQGGAAVVTLLQDPTGYTSLYNGNGSEFYTIIFGGQVNIGGALGPVARNDPDFGAPGFETSEDTPFTTGRVLDNDTDPDDSPLQVNFFSQPQRGPEGVGSVEHLGDGYFLFDPKGDFDFLGAGQADLVSFDYTVTNPDGQQSAPATVTIVVLGVNDAPAISAIPEQTVFEDGVLSNIGFTVSDPDDFTLAVQVTSSNMALIPESGLSLTGTGNNRKLSITPSGNRFGQATVTLTVTDGVNSAQTSFSVTVVPVNDAPQISDINGQSTPEDTPITGISFSVADVDDGVLNITVSSSDPTLLPAAGLVVSGSGSSRLLSIIPAADRSGQATVTVTVSDGNLSDSTSFDVLVNAVNDAPTISVVQDQVTSEDTPISSLLFTVSDVDSEVDVLISTINSLLPPGSVVVSGSGTTRTLTITPSANVSGVSGVVLTATDGQEVAQTSFSVTINPVNDAPVIAPVSNQTVAEDSVQSVVLLSLSDVDGDILGVTVSSADTTLLPLAGLVVSGSGSNRVLSITPAAGRSGSTAVTVVVSDGLLSSSTTFTVEVTPVNDSPTISSIADQTINEDGILSGIEFTVADDDGETPAVFVTSTNVVLLPPGSLVITGSGSVRQLSIVPAANRFGTAVVTVTVSDGLASSSSSFSLTVTSVNDAPMAVADTASGPADLPVVISVLGNDSDTDGTLTAGSVTIVTPPSSGEATPNANGTITFTPAAGSSGTFTFSYQVSDNEGAVSAPAVVSVTIITNSPPVITAIPPQSLFVGGGAIQVPLLVTDADGDSLQVTVATDVPGLLAELNLTGSGSGRTLQLAPGTRSGLAKVTVTAADGVNAPVTRSFEVSVGLIIDAGAGRVASGVMTHRGYANSVAVPFSTSARITGVPEGLSATLFRTNVFDNPGRSELLFSIPTVAGQAYAVDLLFAEIWSGAFGVGRRVFDVMLEESLAIDNLDVFATVGSNRALMRSFEVIGDGNLSIELLRVARNPNISGIRIRPLSAPNTVPTITPIASQQTSEDSAITGIEFTVADAEGQPLMVTVSSANTELLPAAGLVLSGTGANRQLSITPAANRFGTAQVTVSVSDGRATTTRVFTVNVTSVNDAPSVGGDSAATWVNVAVDIPVLSNDSDSDGTLNVATVFITEQSPNGTAVPNADGTIRFSPNPGFIGSTSFRYKVRDNDGGESLPATVSVVVRGNAPPVISALAPIQLSIGGSSGAIPMQVTDSDGDVVTITAKGADLPLTVGVLGSNGNRQLTVVAGDTVGLTTITIIASDGVNPPVQQIVPVSISALIDAGTARPISGALTDRGLQNGAGLRFNGSIPVTTVPGTLAASVPDLFYRSTLFDPAVGNSLQFDVKAGAGQLFAVDLFFAEVWGGAFGRGRRIFDVEIDGKTVLEDFDVFREAGGGHIGIARRFVIESDGNLDIDLRRVIQNPMLSGLRVTPLGGRPEA